MADPATYRIERLTPARGQDFLGSSGIWIGQSGGNTICHNEIAGPLMWGISAMFVLYFALDPIRTMLGVVAFQLPAIWIPSLRTPGVPRVVYAMAGLTAFAPVW